MATIHLHQTTSLTPEQYIAGVTDFGPGRSALSRKQRNLHMGDTPRMDGDGYFFHESRANYFVVIARRNISKRCANSAAHVA